MDAPYSKVQYLSMRKTAILEKKRAELQSLVDDCWMLVAATADLATKAQEMFCTETDEVDEQS